MISLVLREAKKNNTYAIIKNYYPETPTWEKIILSLNHAYHNSESSLGEESRVVTRKDGVKTAIIVFNKFDIVSFHAITKKEDGYHHGGLIPESDLVIKELNKVFQSETPGGKCIINLVGNESEYWVHSDDHDVISWNVLGRVEYKFFKDKDSKEFKSIVLEPGDLVYIPEGVFHEVNVFEPRATFIFQYFKDKTD